MRARTNTAPVHPGTYRPRIVRTLSVRVRFSLSLISPLATDRCHQRPCGRHFFLCKLRADVYRRRTYLLGDPSRPITKWDRERLSTHLPYVYVRCLQSVMQNITQTLKPPTRILTVLPITRGIISQMSSRETREVLIGVFIENDLFSENDKYLLNIDTNIR